MPSDEWDVGLVARELDQTRSMMWERPAQARGDAVLLHEVARTLGADDLRSRALSIMGTVTLNRGDLRGAFTLTADAERHAERTGDPTALIEVAALRAQLSFFSGSYAEALRAASRAVELADETGDPALRIFARRSACLVHGNLESPTWRPELDEVLRLSIEQGDRWQEAISRNDLGHWFMLHGDVAGAEDQLRRGIEIATTLPYNALALGVLHCTRAELRLRTGDAGGALHEAEVSLERHAAFDEPNPYLFGMTIRLEVQALLELGRPDDARHCGERAVEHLGDRVPQARSMILASVATALREAGRVEEAFDALERGAALERAALQELAEIQLGFERATLETKAARHEADALAQTNRELEEVLEQLAQAHAELQERTAQLEALQAQLREQADRDALTGLHNRRHLARRMDGLADDPLPGPLSVAILDLDHFKTINDRYGHAAGDKVLVRTAALLRSVMRGSDLIARTGGEEFLLVLPGTGAGAAREACERLLTALRDETWARVAPGLRVTGSVGIATAPDGVGSGAALEELVNEADARLYEAKRGGRDRAVVA